MKVGPGTSAVCDSPDAYPMSAIGVPPVLVPSRSVTLAAVPALVSRTDQPNKTPRPVYACTFVAPAGTEMDSAMSDAGCDEGAARHLRVRYDQPRPVVEADPVVGVHGQYLA